MWKFLLVLVCRVLRVRLWHCLDTEMATGGDILTDDRSVSTLTWSYKSPGMCGRLMLCWIRRESTSYRLSRRPEADVVRVLHGRDATSVRALVQNQRVIDRGIHEVMLVDMGDTAGPAVSIADLSVLRLQWPVPVLDSLSWLQHEYEQLWIESQRNAIGTFGGGGGGVACTFC